jgi:hypothetical protein
VSVPEPEVVLEERAMGGFRGRVPVWWVAEFSSLEGKRDVPKNGL